MKKLILLVLCFAFAACSKFEYKIFDQSFVSFSGATSYNVACKANVLNTYFVYLTTPAFKEPIEVELELEPGAALTEGVDYQIKSDKKITFLPGIYSMPFRIQWMPHTLSSFDGATLTVSIKSCSRPDIIIGMPGPDGLSKSIVITKVK